MLLSLGMLMLSATQVYTLLTVQLFAFLNLLPVEADIVAVSPVKTSLISTNPSFFLSFRLPCLPALSLLHWAIVAQLSVGVNDFHGTPGIWPAG